MLNMEVENSNENKKLGYYEDSPKTMIIRTLLLSIPVIIDFILTLLSYKKDIELEKYYTLRFIAQGLYIIYIIINVLFTSYDTKVTQGFYWLVQMTYIFLMVIGGFAVFIMESLCLVNFIRNYKLLVLLEEIGYYIHSLVILALVCFRMYHMKSDFY